MRYREASGGEDRVGKGWVREREKTKGGERKKAGRRERVKRGGLQSKKRMVGALDG